jgi:hypothetical protein
MIRVWNGKKWSGWMPDDANMGIIRNGTWPPFTRANEIIAGDLGMRQSDNGDEIDRKEIATLVPIVKVERI